MSYINTKKHKYLGMIGYLNVYLLEERDFGVNCEYYAENGTIVLGGGSGEHPTAIVQELEYLIGLYLKDIIDLYNLELDNISHKIIEKIDRLSNKKFVNNYLTIIKYNKWTFENYSFLHNYQQSLNDDMTTEEWLNFEISKLIIEKYPELNPLQNETEIIFHYLNKQDNSLKLRY